MRRVMCSISKGRVKLLLIGLASAAMFLAPQTMLAATIPADFDFFRTCGPNNLQCPTPDTGFFIGARFVALQGNPFSPGSPFFDPPTGDVIAAADEQGVLRIEWVDRHGNMVSEDSQHRVSQRVVGGFDVAVERTHGVSITGIGSTADVGLQFAYLSLISIVPALFPGVPGCETVACDVHVGLAENVDQILGRMRFLSDSPSGRIGRLDIGLNDGTMDNPAAADFLGLPANVDILFVQGGSSEENDIFARRNNVPMVFHGDSVSPSGTYQVIPEPSTWVLIGVGSVVLLGFRRKRFSTKA